MADSRSAKSGFFASTVRSADLTMKLKEKSLTELKKIIQRDYGVALTNNEANDLGASLLRLTKLASVALARVDEKDSFVQTRNSNSPKK